MKQYIIVGITEKGQKMYARYKPTSLAFEWTPSHRMATQYDDMHIARIDWEHLIKYYSDNMKRIFIPIYDINEPPWNE